MVHVIQIGLKGNIGTGEIVQETDTTFKIHTSSIVFNKNEYRYIKVP